MTFISWKCWRRLNRRLGIIKRCLWFHGFRRSTSSRRPSRRGVMRITFTITPGLPMNSRAAFEVTTYWYPVGERREWLCVQRLSAAESGERN